MLTKDQKARWIAALRQLDRKQVTGALHLRAGQCCLGVLCQIVGPDFGVTAQAKPSGMTYYNDCEATLPGALSEALGGPTGGFEDIFGFLPEEVKESDSLGLVHLNDRAQWTFPQIADLLEKYLPTSD